MGLFDFLDNTASALERVAGSRPAGRRSSTKPCEAQAAPPDPTREAFRVVESVDATTGKPSFVVHNLVGDRAECSSHAFAQRVKDALG